MSASPNVQHYRINNPLISYLKSFALRAKIWPLFCILNPVCLLTGLMGHGHVICHLVKLLHSHITTQAHWSSGLTACILPEGLRFAP
jgi:hypothetical protein